jgi:hypothetical protein
MADSESVHSSRSPSPRHAPQLGLLTGSCYAILGPNAATAVKNYHGGFYHPDFPQVYMPTAKERRKTRHEFLANPPPGKLAFPNLSSGVLLLHPERENEPMPIAAFKTAAIGARDATELDLYLRSVGEAVKHKRYASASDEAARLLSLAYVKLNQLLSVLLRHLSIRCRDLAVFTVQPTLILDALDHFDVDRVHSAFRREQVHAKVSSNSECALKQQQLRSPSSCTITMTTVQSSVESSFDSEDGIEIFDRDVRSTPLGGYPSDSSCPTSSALKGLRAQLANDDELETQFYHFLQDEMLTDVQYTLSILKRLLVSTVVAHSH